MKKTIFIFIIIFLIILTIVCVSLMENSKNLSKIQKENKEYEEYLQKEIYGTDVITLINKVTDNNIKNGIQKDRKGFFIENNTNSIKIEINLLNDKELKTYQMEQLQNVGLEGFVKSFNLIKFKCTKLEYHNDTKKVSKIIFQQIEE